MIFFKRMLEECLSTLKRDLYFILRVCSVVCCVFFLSACAINITVPTGRFESPEVQGKNGFRLDASESVNQLVQLTPDYTVVAPNTKNPEFASTSSFDAGAAYGIDDMVDVGIRNMSTAFAKIQVNGSNRKNAVEGNLPVSVFFGLGKKQSGATGTETIFTSNQRSYFMSQTIFELGGIAGYRLSKFWLLYTGVTYYSNSYSGNYDLIPSSGNRTTSKIDGSVKAAILHYGAEYNYKWLSIKLEVGPSVVWAGKAHNIDAFNFGLMTTAYF